MENKIQPKHPAGKNAVRVDKDKYDVMRKAILGCLKKKGLTHTEFLKAVIDSLKKNKIQFSSHSCISARRAFYKQS